MSKIISLTIGISESASTDVQQMKGELSEAIGWFSSLNSIPHITLCEFEVPGSKTLNRIDSKLEWLCKTEFSTDVKFDTVSCDTTAAVILPDKKSNENLKRIMKRIRNGIRKFIKIYSSYNPHISIGRQLGAAELELAKEIFSNWNEHLNFICDHLCLRIFNEKTQQYDVIKQFPFENLIDRSGEQLSLF